MSPEKPIEISAKLIDKASKVPADTWTAEAFYVLLVAIVVLLYFWIRSERRVKSLEQDKATKVDEELQKQIGALELTIDTKHEAVKNYLAEYDRRIDDSNQRNSGYVNQAVEKMTVVCAQAKADLDNLKREHTGTSDKVNKLMYEQDATKKDVDEMGGELRQMRKTVEGTAREQAVLGQKVDQIEGQVKDIQGAIAKIADQIFDIHKEIVISDKDKT